MATRPQSEHSPERNPELDRQDDFADGFNGQQRLSVGELQVLIDFFRLLQEWDTDQKIV
jgi:hypothetical protein